MKKVIVLYSALVFGLLTYSDTNAWNVDINDVAPSNSTEALEERLNELERIVGPNSQEINIITNHWFQRGYWYGMGKRDDQGRISGKCHPGRIGEFKEALKSIQRRIDELKATNQNNATNSVSTGAGASSQNQNSREYGASLESTSTENSSQDQNSGAHGASNESSQDFNFGSVTSIEEVERLTQEQCQQAVRNGIIDKEKFFAFGIGNNDLAQCEAIEKIINIVNDAGGNVRQARRLNGYSAKIRTLVAKNVDLFRDVEFVKKIKDHLKIFHEGLLSSYNDAHVKTGHPYLRFLIVDKI